MKPTAEMVERARAIVRKRREQPVGVCVTWPDAIAQALADEHERAMEECARLAECPDYLEHDLAAAIRAAAKG